MDWFFGKKFRRIPPLPNIKEISKEIPAVSEHLDAFRLPEAFKQANSDTIPVINTSGNVIGVVTEYDLAKVLPEWSFEEESYRHNISVSQIMTRNVWTEPEDTNIRELLSRIHEMHIRVIPIIDEDGIYTGKCITRTSLISYLTDMVKPRSIGGLATPLGVYLTDGRHQAGSKTPGLLLTGVALGSIIFVVELITNFIYRYFNLSDVFAIILELTLFILVLRLTPLVKYHAAEHQTIHAIEKGLPLTPETVKMQPRPHRRCGTNLMVFLLGLEIILILSVKLAKISSFVQFLFLITGFMFFLSNWRNIGMVIQQYLTTAKAPDSYIKNGIKAGEELLKLHKEDIKPDKLGLLEKVWNMGLFQILFSFFITVWILHKIINVLW